MDKTQDFWTNLRHLDKGEDRTEGRDKTDRTDGEEGQGKGEEKGRARGIYPGEGVGEN